jgi:rhodanese-related sulfurtransferase
METESCIRVLAGSLVLISISLGHFVSSWWLLLAVFVGVNLVQSVFTGFFPAETILHKFGLGELDRSRPVVTVCALGKTSYFAARILAQNGFQVSCLTGGIRAAFDPRSPAKLPTP